MEFRLTDPKDSLAIQLSKSCSFEELSKSEYLKANVTAKEILKCKGDSRLGRCLHCPEILAQLSTKPQPVVRAEF